MKKTLASTNAPFALSAAPAKSRPMPTDNQATFRETTRMLAKIWQSLGFDEKDTFLSLAQQLNTARPSVLGLRPRTSAYLTFLTLSRTVYAATGTVPRTAPNAPQHAVPLPPLSLTISAAPNDCRLTLHAAPYDAPVLIYAAAAVSASQNIFAKPDAFKLLGSLPALTSQNDLTALYVAKFRAPAAGGKVAFKIVGLSPGGFRTAEACICARAEAPLSAAETVPSHSSGPQGRLAAQPPPCRVVHGPVLFFPSITQCPKPAFHPLSLLFHPDLRYNNRNTMEETLPKPPAYSVLTWGCQMNEDDSQQMAAMLEAEGYALAETPEDATVVLLNTCSVRAKPERKVYSKLGELRELKLANPKMVIGVCGCMAQKEAPEIRRRAPYVDLVIGTGQIDRLPALLKQVQSERVPLVETALPDRKHRDDKPTPRRVIAGGPPKLKTFVSISYGCDKFCTFCIVPLTRGKERSRPAEEIILEVERLASLGTKEVTLLGQTVNSYGKFLDDPCSFAELLHRLSAIEGIERIRYTSPYPKDFSTDVIDAIATLPKVCPQVHMPIQVADDNLLSRMHRGYTLEQYRTIVHTLRTRVPDVCLTTDLMLGFPGETDEECENTLRFVEETRYDAAFMFAYSPREGTKAAMLGDQIPEEVKLDRLHRLIDIQNRITEEINISQVGTVYDVLVERRSPKDPNKWTGQNPQGKTINFPATRDLAGQIVPVRAVRAHLWGFTGELLPAREKLSYNRRGIALAMAAA